MKITFEQGMELAELLLRLFGRGRRAQLLAKALETVGQLEDFKRAREEIDECVRDSHENYNGPLLTFGEALALDTYLDLTRRPKRFIRDFIRRNGKGTL